MHAQATFSSGEAGFKVCLRGVVDYYAAVAALCFVTTVAVEKVLQGYLALERTVRNCTSARHYRPLAPTVVVVISEPVYLRERKALIKERSSVCRMTNVEMTVVFLSW